MAHVNLGENYELVEEGDDFVIRHIPSGDEFRYDAFDNEWQPDPAISVGEPGDIDITEVDGIDEKPTNVGALVGGGYHDGRTSNTGGYGVVFEAAGITIHSVVIDAEESTSEQPIELREYQSNATDPPVVDSTTVSLSGGPERVDLGFEVPTSGNGDPDDMYYLARGAEPSGEEVGLRRLFDADGEWSSDHYDNEVYPEAGIDFIRGGHTGDYDAAGVGSWYYFFDWLVSDDSEQVVSPRSTDVAALYSRSRDPTEEEGSVSPRSLWVDHAENAIKRRGTDGWEAIVDQAQSGGFEGSTIAGRPVISEEGNEWEIPSDYSTLQDAIDDTLPLFLRHELRYTLEDGYYEDDPVFLPPVLSMARLEDYTGSSEFNSADIRIRSADRSSSVGGSSGLSAGMVIHGASWGSSGVRLDHLNITGNINDGDNISLGWRRDVGILTETANEISMYDCDFSGSGGYSCVEPRSSTVNLEGCHVGDGDWEKGVYQKRGNHVTIDTITGSTTSEVLESRYGIIYVRSFEASGGSGDFDSDMGLIFERHNGTASLHGPTDFPDT